MTIKVRVTLDAVNVNLNPADYEDRWAEKCDEDGHEEGEDYPPIPVEFVVECYEEDLNNGAEDISSVFESASVDVKRL